MTVMVVIAVILLLVYGGVLAHLKWLDHKYKQWVAADKLRQNNPSEELL